MSMARGLAIIGACWGAGFAAVAGGIGIGRIGGSCIEAIARQPEAAGALFAPMIISAAMVEGGMLFAIVVCLMGILA
ncbi:MAG TPA: F0F1 ATP synthase subunit C [Phycisphaerae bacterium]|nr:F0F1 ATP synthase subunit C [Phycisphaerae bacterium]HQL71891.1 F0F1 ATP synthase subunit C [Phycisphaerae bacterium]